MTFDEVFAGLTPEPSFHHMANIIANHVLEDMTREELIQFAYDRYMDDLLKLNPTALKMRYEEVKNASLFFSNDVNE